MDKAGSSTSVQYLFYLSWDVFLVTKIDINHVIESFKHEDCLGLVLLFHACSRSLKIQLFKFFRLRYRTVFLGARRVSCKERISVTDYFTFSLSTTNLLLRVLTEVLLVQPGYYLCFYFQVTSKEVKWLGTTRPVHTVGFLLHVLILLNELLENLQGHGSPWVDVSLAIKKVAYDGSYLLSSWKFSV